MDTIIQYAKPDPAVVELFVTHLDCHPLLARLLSIRNIRTLQEARTFLDPRLETLKNPFSLKDMDAAVERLAAAVENKEKILVFGDFDADGVTATALLVDFLEHCRADVSWYIPHRTREGYGLQVPHVRMAADQDVDLIVTVDCGVTSVDAVREAAVEDIDVIVTDHHEPGPELPPAKAVIDPKRRDCDADLGYLAGVGVAFFLVMALRKCLRDREFWEEIPEPNLMDSLDLFTIGTIGDMVPLVHINRTLCLAGFKRIRQACRPGLKSLVNICRLDPARVDSDDISFKIVPRINAAGRISHARICVSQLTETDRGLVEKTALLLDQLNLKRQKIEQDIILDIENRLEKDGYLLKSAILFMWDDRWNPSVLGIAASKLAKKYFRPVILLSTAGENAVGSCRSIDPINIHEALKACEPLLVRFGGHAMAAGLTVRKTDLSTLRHRLNACIDESFVSVSRKKTLVIDAVLELTDITIHLAREIDRLRPFGVDNPEPVFLCEHVRVASSCVIGQVHRKMLLEKSDFPGHRVEAFHFNAKDPNQPPGYYPKLAFKIKTNKFRPDAVQIIVEDL